METIKLGLGVTIILAMALLGYKLVPPYFSNYQFEDAIKNDAVQGTYSNRSVEDIRAAVVKQAQEFDISLTPQQVHVVRTGGFGTGVLQIDAEYSIPVELPGYSTSLSFHPSTENKGVY
ncbi:MAG: hypothetical protein WBQ72_17635 [Terriglobales bacterium]|jgi:YbbR domain-containing protein